MIFQKFFTILIFFFQTEAIQLDDCYYSKDDLALNAQVEIPMQSTFLVAQNDQEFNSIGFGVWTKWIPNLYYSQFDYPQRPFDDPNCEFEDCILQAIYFFNIFDLDGNNIITIILSMSDDPLILNHDIYVFPYENEQYFMESLVLDPIKYSNIWIYTSLIYKHQDQEIQIFTNYENQLKIFQQEIRTNGFSIIFGGYKDDLSKNSIKTGQQLLYFKGKYSPLQDYGNFNFYDNFFNDLFYSCKMQTQNSTIKIFDVLQQLKIDYENPTTIYDVVAPISEVRYSFQCWIQQRYDKALKVAQDLGLPYSSVLTQVVLKATANNLFQDKFNGDQGFILSYDVDLENNNKTTIFIQTYFLKIPLLTPVYHEMEQYYKFKLEGDDYYQKTSEWHYFIFDYGRTPINGSTAQFRLYFMNKEPIVLNFGTYGFNSQFNGPLVNIYLLFTNSYGLNGYALMLGLLYKTGHSIDNNEKYSKLLNELVCDISCFDCNGPYKNNCTKCYEDNNYFLTQFNTCECQYLYTLDQNSLICIPIEETQNLQITQTKINVICQIGYFSFTYQNNFYCLECPKQQKNALICGDCYEKQTSWYLKPMCTYDYIQNSEDFVYIRYDRKNQDIDVYYINENMNLMLEDGASLMCDQNQIGCYKSKNYHLGQQIKIQCKLNRYYNQQVCQYCDQLCVNCDQNGNCIECQDQYYFNQQSQSCQHCPSQCQSCQTDFNSILGFKCTKCIKQYAFLQGLCMPCGLNCDYCRQDFNQQSQKYFLRCLSCIDNTIMSVRLNAIDCKAIVIQNCLYTIMYQVDNFDNNSINSLFEPSDDLSLEKFGCTLCENNYYLYNLEVCIQFQPDDTIQWCETAMQIHIIFNNIDYGQFRPCILGSNIYSAITLGQQCQQVYDNCYFCLSVLNSQFGRCLKCNQGYYANKLKGYCYNCPQELYCQTCSQTPIGYNDEWKMWSTPVVQIITTMIKQEYTYDFRQHMQSQSEQDYQIICTSCYNGYILLNNVCIKYCDDDCLNCLLIDGQYKCQNCQSSIYTKVLSLIQNKCTLCSAYCEFCSERTNDQLQEINPMFEKGNQASIYQYQCFKPMSFQNDSLLYNPQIGQFLSCGDNQITSTCQNKLQIIMNLYCSTEAYNQDFNSLNDQKSQILFKQKNILFDSLITHQINETSFSQFESNEINEILSQKSVSLIEIIIESQISQQCTVSTFGYVQQLFSKNLINLNNVHLSIVSKEQQYLTIEIVEELHFLYFSSLKFENVIFQFQNNIYWKILNFNSFQPQSLLFQNSLVTTTSATRSTVFTIIILNVYSFIMKNFQFSNINAENNGQISLIQITTYQNQKTDAILQLINLSIFECTFNKLTFINFEASELYSIQIDQLMINSTFYFSKFVSFISNNKIKEFKFSNSNISGNIMQSLPFISLGNINQIFLNNIKIHEAVITDSTIFQVDKQLASEFLYLDSCQTFGQVSFIENNNDEQNGNEIIFNYFIQNFTAINLLYGSNTKLIYFKKLRSTSSNVQIFSVTLINNQINLQTVSAFETQQYLINIEQQIIDIDSVIIIRGIGISEFLFQNSVQLTINNFQATARKFYAIHQFQECQSFFQFQDYFKSIIQIQNTQNVLISNIQFKFLNLINNAMIQIDRESNFLSEQDDQININNLKVTNTIQTLTKKNSQTSLIKISSNFKISINLFQCSFIKNQLHMYQQNTLLNSAVLLLITCPSGILNFQQSNMTNNFLSNGTDTIIHVITNQIMVNQVNFYNNSIFDVQNFISHIDWGFNQNTPIEESNLKQIFHLKNNIGNGFYQAEKIEINTVRVINSQGKNGVGFYIQAIEVVLIDAYFENMKSFFEYNEENGGCLYFYLTSDYCKIQIQNMTLNSILTQDNGGIIYIQSDFDHLQLKLQNIKVNDAFSRCGSIIYASFQKNSINNLIQIDNLKITNTKSGLLNYLQNINDISKFSDFIANRILICLQNSVILFSNIIINSNFVESLLQCQNQGNLTILDLYVFSGTISKLSFLDITPRQDQIVQIIFQNISISNLVQFSQDLYSNGTCDYLSYTKTSQQFNMQCNLHSDVSDQSKLSQVLIFEDEYKNAALSKCLFDFLINQITLETNSLIQINNIKENDQLDLTNIRFENNHLNNSNSGLLYFQIIRQSQKLNFHIEIKEIKIENSRCGIVGCLYLNSDIFNVDNQLISNVRILDAKTNILLANSNPDIRIKKYICFDNLSSYGTCIFSKNINIIIENSFFQNNIANKVGGAIYFEGQHYFLYIYKSIIQLNQAQIGGGVYYKDVQGQDQEKFQTKIIQNRATYFGNDSVQAPSHQSITLNNYRSIFQITEVESQVNFVREQISNSFTSQQILPIYLPSGTPISNYKILNQNTMELIPLNLTFRIVPLDQQFQKINNLIGSSCSIQTKIFNLSSNLVQDSLQTHISKNYFEYNSTSEDYNLDEVIIYFDSDNFGNTTLQLQVSCSDMMIPVYDKNNLSVVGFHQNYTLLININTFKCRIGEIKSLTDYSCHECDPTLDQYSIQLNEIKCSLRDEQTTTSVNSYNLNIRSGYWRPNYNNNIIAYCLNLKENCLGGWYVGDNSCFQGHIGALCESCDLYNIRGQGQYSVSQQYSCGSCEIILYNTLQIIFFSIWSLITIVLSVKGNITKQYTYPQSPQLIKILTNYLQIISCLTTFKLNLPINFFVFINGIGTPIGRISDSMDCFLTQITSIQVHYARLIWQILIPCSYFSLLSLIYGILIYQKKMQYHGSTVSTALIFMFIYFQPSLIGSLIALISTRVVSGISWIQANMAYQFDTPSHYQWVYMLCAPFLLLFGVLIPLTLFISLYRIKDKLIYKKGKSRLGYLYHEYKPNAYFWEIVKILNKQFLILFLIYYEDSIILKGTLVYVLLFCYRQLNSKYQPFKLQKFNKLDFESTAICGISIIFGIGLSIEITNQFQTIKVIYFFILILINIYIVCKLLYTICIAYSEEFEKSVELIKYKIRRILPNRIKQTYPCLKFLQSRVETRERAFKNFKILFNAYKKQKQIKTLFQTPMGINSLLSLQTTFRFKTIEREKGSIEKDLLQSVQKNENY